jgi:hypothetical protein
MSPGNPGRYAGASSNLDVPPAISARNAIPRWFVFSRVRNDPSSSTREAGGPRGAPQTPQDAAKGPGRSEAGLAGAGAQRGAQAAHNSPGGGAYRLARLTSAGLRHPRQRRAAGRILMHLLYRLWATRNATKPDRGAHGSSECHVSEIPNTDFGERPRAKFAESPFSESGWNKAFRYDGVGGASHSLRKSSRSALIVSASVLGIPCGKPSYVFSVPFCRSRADSGAELA